MTSFLVIGTMLVGAVAFAAIRHGLAARGSGAPLGLGVKEPSRDKKRAES